MHTCPVSLSRNKTFTIILFIFGHIFVFVANRLKFRYRCKRRFHRVYFHKNPTGKIHKTIRLSVAASINSQRFYRSTLVASITRRRPTMTNPERVRYICKWRSTNLRPQTHNHIKTVRRPYALNLHDIISTYLLIWRGNSFEKKNSGNQTVLWYRRSTPYLKRKNKAIDEFTLSSEAVYCLSTRYSRFLFCWLSKLSYIYVSSMPRITLFVQ